MPGILDAHRHLGVLPAFPFYDGPVVNPDTTARTAGVRLLALPEAALGGYLVDLDGAAGTPPALTPDGPEIRRLAQLAGDMVVAVGYCEQGSDQLFNSAVCVTGDGYWVSRFWAGTARCTSRCARMPATARATALPPSTPRWAGSA